MVYVCQGHYRAFMVVQITMTLLPVLLKICSVCLNAEALSQVSVDISEHNVIVTYNK